MPIGIGGSVDVGDGDGDAPRTGRLAAHSFEELLRLRACEHASVSRRHRDDHLVKQGHEQAEYDQANHGSNGEIEQRETALLDPWASHARVTAQTCCRLNSGHTLWYKGREEIGKLTELERALSDLAEVRERLAMAQRFKGYSGVAAILSGCFAIAAGVVQKTIVPAPQGVHEQHLYFAIWFLCAALAAMVNYGAILNWFWSDASARDRWQTRTVGLAILPALLLGAGFSFALLARGEIGVLPGVWYGCYGVGLFASRTMLPRGVLSIAAAFLAIGIALFFAPASVALAWWVLPVGFGIGQIAIGALIRRDATLETLVKQ